MEELPETGSVEDFRYGGCGVMYAFGAGDERDQANGVVGVGCVIGGGDVVGLPGNGGRCGG